MRVEVETGNGHAVQVAAVVRIAPHVEKGRIMPPAAAAAAAAGVGAGVGGEEIEAAREAESETDAARAQATGARRT